MSALPNGKLASSSATAAAGDSQPNNAAMTSPRAVAIPTGLDAAALWTDASRQDDLRRAIEGATSTAEVRAALEALHAHEAALTAKSGALLAAQADLSRSLGRLDNLRAGLGAQVIAARGISNSMLSGAAQTAARLSGRVRALDLEQARVADTLRVVEQVAELKACVAGVVGSMGAPQDWEAAAGYLARVSKVPERIVQSGFATAVVPTVEVPDPPAVTLDAARESLCGLFLREFDKAVADSDDARVTRFFKLFPLIGRGDVGLDVYGKYVCQGVAARARAVLREGAAQAQRNDGFFYANALMRLFDHIAKIVDGHGSLVERHYGAGRMVKVIERLQMEADVQGGILLDTWSEERGVDRRLTDVKSYPFSFLVQSFLPQQRGLVATPRVGSPATGGSHVAEARNSEDEGVNMKEVDGLLNEIAVMLGRWSLYCRFLAGKCKDPEAAADAHLAMPGILTKSNLHQKVLSKLTTPYNIMTTFFFRRSIEKAFQLDEPPSGLSLNMNRAIEGNPPYIISAVDDVMYIVNAVIQKALSTLQQEVVGDVIPTINRVLGSDFIGMIQRKMRDESYPKALVQGGFPPEDKIISFIVLMNSLDISVEYLARIISGRLGRPGDTVDGDASQHHPHLRESFPFDKDVTLVINSLKTLRVAFTSKTTELLTTGLQILFNQIVKPRLRPVLTDTFRDADYTLTEAELADHLADEEASTDQAAVQDQVARRFEHGWDALMRPLARLMTANTYATVLELTASHLARVLEKRVWALTGRATAVGAARMQRDVSGIVSVVARGSYAVREVFGRTTQALMVATMEEDEWEDLSRETAGGAVAEEDGMVWLLSEEERSRARKLLRE